MWPGRAIKLKSRLRQSLKEILFGAETLPMRFFIGQPQPQEEVAVWLHGFGPPRNVTRCHGPASTIPCTFWIAFNAVNIPREKECARMSLNFREAGNRQRLLGTLGLRHTDTIQAGKSVILVFEPRSAVSYCHPRFSMYAHEARQRWNQRHSTSKIKLSSLEQRAMGVLFTCPRPISLVTVAEPGRASMFPLNVMSDVNDRHFAFALTASKIPAQFLASAGRFALSVTPIEQAPVAFALAANHNVASVEIRALPFPTRLSPQFRLPVPIFSPRVREMEIESVNRVGSHSLFVARTVTDERTADGLEFSVIHGFYQAWRIRHGLDSPSSIAQDALIRAGTPSSAVS
jgi:flavin reductase (DIM6/NTAB) family NADH-FMN oxidoreductase RutF